MFWYIISLSLRVKTSRLFFHILNHLPFWVTSIRNSIGNGYGCKCTVNPAFFRNFGNQKNLLQSPSVFLCRNFSRLSFLLSLSGRAILNAFFPPKPNALIFIFFLLIETIKKPCWSKKALKRKQDKYWN